MKTLLHKGSFILAFIFTIYFGFQNKAVAQNYSSINFQTFYNELSPYGNWIHDRNYGYVWIPDVGPDFWPYGTSGHWVMTEFGNTWVSDYSWGWAPFHYGRWVLDDYYGWMWIPGTEWAPAWVAWRNGGGYYGWAPLGPGININVSLNIGRYVPDNYWVFVNYNYFHSRRFYRYCVPRHNVVNIVHNTTIINNTYVDNSRYTYYTGPRAADIERVTHRSVRVNRIAATSRPNTTTVRNGAVSVYRPNVERGGRDLKPAVSYDRDTKTQNVAGGKSYQDRANAQSGSRVMQSPNRRDQGSLNTGNSRTTVGSRTESQINRGSSNSSSSRNGASNINRSTTPSRQPASSSNSSNRNNMQEPTRSNSGQSQASPSRNYSNSSRGSNSSENYRSTPSRSSQDYSRSRQAEPSRSTTPSPSRSSSPSPSRSSSPSPSRSYSSSPSPSRSSSPSPSRSSSPSPSRSYSSSPSPSRSSSPSPSRSSGNSQPSMQRSSSSSSNQNSSQPAQRSSRGSSSNSRSRGNN